MSGEELRAALEGALTKANIDFDTDGDPSDLDVITDYVDAALAAPSTPEPSGHVICGVAGCVLHKSALPAAPPTEPALDVERLAKAIKVRATTGSKSALIRPRNDYSDLAADIAAEYARLAESQP